MKYCFHTIALFALYYSACAQDSLAGFWISKDSSRIYYLHKSDSGYKAVIHWSCRKQDASDALILNDVQPAKKKNYYHGVIYSVYNAPPLHAKIHLSKQGKILNIKIPRMYIFPVHIRWIKKE